MKKKSFPSTGKCTYNWKCHVNVMKIVMPCKKQNKTRHVFVKHGCPWRRQSQTMAKISKSYILNPPHPQGHVMSVKCEQPLDELTVQVWLLYDHPNFKYCTLFKSGTELRTEGQTEGRTIQTLDAPVGPFRLGVLKNKIKNPLNKQDLLLKHEYPAGHQSPKWLF